MKLNLMILAMVLPLGAQVQWVSSTAVEVNPMFATPQRNRICRVLESGNAYAGIERQSQCHYVRSGANQTASSYEVAEGLGKWEASGLSGATTLGNIQGLPARVCRVKVAGALVSGYAEGSPQVCRVATVSGAQTLNKFELLYDFTSSGEFHVMQQGLCITARVGQTPPLQLKACGSLLADQWRFAAGGKLESVLFAGQCLIGANVPVPPLFLQVPGSQLTACSSAPALQLENFTDTTYRIRNVATGEALGRGTGLTTGAPPRFLPAVGDANEAFEVLTLNEASRRLSVLSYNIMLLPDDQFPGLKQEERAGWIPDSLNRAGALADVIAFQEGFQTSARNVVTGKLLADHGYLWFTGVPDWPDAAYNSEFLNPLTYLSFGQFRTLTNGGVFISSRWPIDRTAYTKFRATSLDGPFDGTGFDAFAAKGVTYARLQKLGRRYHVFTTHLQAGPPDDEAGVRNQQLQEMRNFATLMLIGASNEDGVIFAGDFNIDMETDVPNYNYLLDTLRVGFVDAPRPVGTSSDADLLRWTVNPTTNRISQERESGFSWLDYVFVENLRAAVDRASYQVFQFEHNSSFQINVAVLSAGTSFMSRDLSDHGAVLARFRFAPSAVTAVPAEVVDLSLRTETRNGNPVPNGAVIVNGGAVTTPNSIDVVRNEPIEVQAFSFLPGTAGQRFRFLNWVEGGGQTQSFVPTGSNRLTAQYMRQFELKTESNPIGAGTVTGAGFYDEDGEATVTATAGAGFAFTGFTGLVNGPRNPVSVRTRQAATVTANFVSTGQPRLSLLTDGARTEPLPGIRRLYLRMVNSGAGGAVNARVVGVQSMTVLSGTGTVTLLGPQAVNFGAIAAGATSGLPGPLEFVWPATATRVRITFLITAGGGYSTTATLTLIR